MDELAHQSAQMFTTIEDGRRVVSAKYSLAKMDHLSTEDHAVVDRQSLDALNTDYRLGFFDDRLTVDRLSQAEFRRDFSELEEIYLRLAGLYLSWRVVQFMYGGFFSAPNVFQAMSLSSQQNVFLLFDLLFLWRLNDMHIQTLPHQYRRFSDIDKLDVTESLSMLLGRYLFSTWFVCWILGGLIERGTGINHVYTLELMAHVLLCQRLLPVLKSEFWALSSSSAYAQMNRPFVAILSESLQTVQSYAVFANRLCAHVHAPRSSLAPFLDLHGHTAYQKWRLAEFGVSLLGTLPGEVTVTHLHQLITYCEHRSVDDVTDALTNDRSTLLSDWNHHAWQHFILTSSPWWPLFLNSLDGRALVTLIHGYHAVYFAHHHYDYRYKLQTLRRGSALLLERPDLIMFVAQMVMPRTNFFASRMTEFMRSFLCYAQDDALFRRRLIYFVDLAASQEMGDDFFHNLVLLVLRSDIFDCQSVLVSDHVMRFLQNRVPAHAQDPVASLALAGRDFSQGDAFSGSSPHLDHAMLLLRDFARVLAQAPLRTDAVLKTLHFLCVSLQSAKAVQWSADADSQAAIVNVWQRLAEYFAAPVQVDLHGQDLESAVTRLACLPDEACVVGSVEYTWAFFDCINTVFRGAGVVQEVCGRPFRQLAAEQMLAYLNDEHIEYLRTLFGQRIDDNNHVDVICCFLDLVATLIAYDFPGCFQKSFESSVDCNDFLRVGQNIHDNSVPYYDFTSRLIQSLVRFIDHVERQKEEQAQLNNLFVLNQDQSMIFCLGLFFEYIGKGRIYAADWLSSMMYRSVFENQQYLKWSLLWLDASFAGLSLLRGIFLRSERLQWRSNLQRLLYGTYFVMTRFVWHVPRALYFIFSLCVILLGTFAYNLDYIIFRMLLTKLDHMKMILACVCAVGSVALALTWALPPICMPGVMCVIYTCVAWLLDSVIPGKKDSRSLLAVEPVLTQRSVGASDFQSQTHHAVPVDNGEPFWVLPPSLRDAEMNADVSVDTPASNGPI